MLTCSQLHVLQHAPVDIAVWATYCAVITQCICVGVSKKQAAEVDVLLTQHNGKIDAFAQNCNAAYGSYFAELL